MTAPHDPLGPEAAAVERGRLDAQRGWAKHREARLAAGLPATREQELGRSPRFLDPESEPWWIARLLELGLGSQSDSRTSLRKAAKRLADVEAAQLVAEQAASGDDALLLAYHRAEAERWQRSADRAAALARVHARNAHESAYQASMLEAKVEGKA